MLARDAKRTSFTCYEGPFALQTRCPSSLSLSRSDRNVNYHPSTREHKSNNEAVRVPGTASSIYPIDLHMNGFAISVSTTNRPLATSNPTTSSVSQAVSEHWRRQAQDLLGQGRQAEEDIVAAREAVRVLTLQHEEQRQAARDRYVEDAYFIGDFGFPSGKVVCCGSRVTEVRFGEIQRSGFEERKMLPQSPIS